jgi:hypothetical protein
LYADEKRAASRRLNGARDVYGRAADNRFVTQMKDTFVFANQYLQINGVIMVLDGLLRQLNFGVVLRDIS